MLLQTQNLRLGEKSWAPVLSLDLKSRNPQLRNRYVVCMSVQQASKSKVAVSPLELEERSQPPLNLYKPKEPYTATIVSVERVVGAKAPGETCHIVIDHGGNVPYWEGQSYGVIPPVSNVFILNFLVFNHALIFTNKRNLDCRAVSYPPNGHYSLINCFPY